MTVVDPARTPKRTKEEMLRIYQAGCRTTPCESIRSGRLTCPFCPWIKKFYLQS